MTDVLTLADGRVLRVAEWPLPPGVQDGVLNLSQLAVAFGVSNNSVTKWLGQGLPVLTQGQNGVSYEFQLSHCWAWRESRNAEAIAKRAQGDKLAQQAALLFRNLSEDEEQDEATLTAAEVRAWAEAEYHRNRVAEQRGDLVRADRARHLFEDVLQSFTSHLDTLPDWLEMNFSLTPEQVQKTQDRLDQMRSDVRNKWDKALGASAQVLPINGQPQQTAMGF